MRLLREKISKNCRNYGSTHMNLILLRSKIQRIPNSVFSLQNKILDIGDYFEVGNINMDKLNT